LGDGLKPPPTRTNFLPLRTHPAVNPLSTIAETQSEAYYEEIGNIPAVSMGIRSEFRAGHIYLVHPISYYTVRDMSNKTLKDMAQWIEDLCPNKFFTRKAHQVMQFRAARTETLYEMYKELTRRKKRGEAGEESGYTGDWEFLRMNRKWRRRSREGELPLRRKRWMCGRLRTEGEAHYPGHLIAQYASSFATPEQYQGD
jgi:hypothetical protein